MLKQKWRISILLLGVLVVACAWLWAGERGFTMLLRTGAEREAHMERIQRLAQENQALQDEIHSLRNNMTYVEEVVRKELHLVRDNEVIYRFSRSPVTQGLSENTAEAPDFLPAEPGTGITAPTKPATR